jgi:hypothetical protein
MALICDCGNLLAIDDRDMSPVAPLYIYSVASEDDASFVLAVYIG